MMRIFYLQTNILKALTTP